VRVRVLVVVAVLASALGVAAPIWGRVQHARDHGGTAFRAADTQRAALVTGSGRSVLVIGDSYAAGWLAPLDDSWPTRLPGRVRVDGFPGSGFSAGASPCGAVDFAARAERGVRDGADLVVVQGGLNDFDQPDAAVEEGFAGLVAATRGRELVVVGPPPAPAREAQARHVDALLARLCGDAGVRYVSTIGLDLPYLDDHLHLTPEGHRAFGDAVATALSTEARSGA
jgi:acyl-CoA thioesterase-1